MHDIGGLVFPSHAHSTSGSEGYFREGIDWIARFRSMLRVRSLNAVVTGDAIKIEYGGKVRDLTNVEQAFLPFEFKP